MLWPVIAQAELKWFSLSMNLSFIARVKVKLIQIVHEPAFHCPSEG
ncbi:hypothetical protein [Neobacillus cucumis]|nr:hypothetical protein [Neobacillus cucumis]